MMVVMMITILINVDTLYSGIWVDQWFIRLLFARRAMSLTWNRGNDEKATLPPKSTWNQRNAKNNPQIQNRASTEPRGSDLETEPSLRWFFLICSHQHVFGDKIMEFFNFVMMSEVREIPEASVFCIHVQTISRTFERFCEFGWTKLWVGWLPERRRRPSGRKCPN